MFDLQVNLQNDFGIYLLIVVGMSKYFHNFYLTCSNYIIIFKRFNNCVQNTFHEEKNILLLNSYSSSRIKSDCNHTITI